MQFEDSDPEGENEEELLVHSPVSTFIYIGSGFLDYDLSSYYSINT